MSAHDLQPGHFTALHLLPVLMVATAPAKEAVDRQADEPSRPATLRPAAADPHGKRSFAGKLLTSAFFVALSLFWLLNNLVGANKLWQAKPTDFPYRSWTAWAIDDFLKRTPAPDLVFLGSSLVLVPLSGVDADYLGKRLDGTQHHSSLYFEHQFKKLTGSKITTFNFALPGEMPSDAYMITDFLLGGKKRPRIIVYGVGPRDFMDNLLPSPAATDPFRFLAPFGDINAFAARAMPEWTDRLNFELGKIFYFWGQKAGIADHCLTLAAACLERHIPAPPAGRQITLDEKRQILPDYHPFALNKGEAFFRPSTKADLANFADNLPEYRKRYRKLKWDTFLTQMGFFADTLSTARQHGTQVIVVAMPITDLNRSLLSDLAWQTYRGTLKALAASKGASFVDLNESKAFCRSDFGDTVHLHSGGGKKLLDSLADNLSQDRNVRDALYPSPDNKRTGLAGSPASSL